VQQFDQVGARFTLFIDPDGNIIELLEFPEDRAENRRVP
jgi:hypothetical protein